MPPQGLAHSQKPLTRRWKRNNLLILMWQITRLRAFCDAIKSGL
jgi:hypothetical protein